jgi:CRP-like cAMP-binding protein
VSLEDNIRALERTPVLADLGREALRLLAFSIEQKRLAPREVLFAMGDEADCAYVVVSGRIGLADAKGEVRMVGAGTLIGEIALVVPTTRPCDALASDNSHLLVIPRALFRRVLEEFPQIAQVLRQRLVAKMRAEAEGLEQIRDSLSRLPGG